MASQSLPQPRVGIYARVPTLDQSTDSQILDLRRYVTDRGWQIFREYCDNGVSGTKDSRPALNSLMDDARKRRFEVVPVWRFDRFARSTKHLILALEEFRNLGIDFVSYQENIDTSSPLGSAIFTIISAVAQLERDIIAERVRAGLRRAVERGKRLGRPTGQGEPGKAAGIESSRPQCSPDCRQAGSQQKYHGQSDQNPELNCPKNPTTTGSRQPP